MPSRPPSRSAIERGWRREFAPTARASYDLLMNRLSAFAALLLGFALALPAAAQPKDSGKPDAPHKEGEYQGVKPGASEFKPKKSKVPTLTWVGFLPRADGSSRVFVQLNREVDYDQALDDKGVLHVTLAGARFGSRNARRRLDTSYFDTPLSVMTSGQVRKARARKGRPGHRAGIEFRFQFKTPADAQQAQISMQKEADGYHYLYLDFGPAKERPERGNGREDAVDSGDDVAP